MFITESWFWRGTQSAIFYYISCAPCSKVLYRRQKQKEAKRAKAEKRREKALKEKAAEDDVTDAAENMRYDHPLPSGTNPYWKEEMALGPGPPPKQRNRIHDRDREREKGGLKAGSMETQGRTSGTGSTGNSKGTSSDGQDGAPHAGVEVAQEATTHEAEEGWNRRRYQREDELLWGVSADHDPTLPGAPLLSRTPSGGRGQGSYYYARNPAVNDLHPPVVSTAPKSRVETQWMLQPPPRAKIMEGKEKENRSRSGTGSTRSSRASSKRAVENGLGRAMAEGRLKRAGGAGDQLQAAVLLGVGGVSMSRSQGSSNQSMASIRTAMQQGQQHERDLAAAAAAAARSHPSPDPFAPQRSNPPSIRTAAGPPVAIDSDATPSSPPAPPRPALATIPSTSLVATDPKPPASLYPPLAASGASATSLHIPRDLLPPSSPINRSASLNTHETANSNSTGKTSAQRKDEDLASHFRNNAWGWGVEGEGRSVHGNGGAGHRHRWSMDI